MYGILLVIDGPDGSGKGTQHELLVARLKESEIAFEAFDFPQYGNPSASFVEDYLAGNFGSLSDIGPREASLFFALDRYAAKNSILTALRGGKVCLMNRYVLANAAHQGAKISDFDDRQAFFKWLDDLEHVILGLPRPTMNIVLRLDDIEEAQRRVDLKSARSYLKGRKRDIHEDDIGHLRAAQNTYTEIVESISSDAPLGENHPTQYVTISAEGNPRAVHDRIWTHLYTILEPLTRDIH